MKRIAYIPARSGSKGVPKKNIRPLCGKPLMGWMIDAALKTGLFDRVMVSTDTEEFAEVARRCGAWVPFLRDAAVARDASTTVETVCSDKVRLEAMGEVFDTFCLLQPTVPFCCAEDILGAVSLHERVHAGVVSVVRTAARPMLLRTLDAEHHARPLLDVCEVLRRQDEPIFYELNGAIYINSWEEIVFNHQFAFNPYAYVMDRSHSIDIDTEEDFSRAESFLSQGRTLVNSNPFGVN